MDPAPLPAEPVAEDTPAAAPAAAAAADASAASNDQREPAGQVFYAIRSGSSSTSDTTIPVKSAIFLRWADAEPHVTSGQGSEYQRFGSLEDAAKYLVGGGMFGDTAPAGAAEARSSGVTASAAASSSGDKRKRTGDDDDDDNNDDSEPIKKRRTKKEAKKKSKKTKKSKSKKKAPPTQPGREPTEKWQLMYERLRDLHTTSGSTTIPVGDAQNDDLRKWLINQRSQLNATLRKCTEEGTVPSSHIETKVSQLEALGVDIRNASRTAKNANRWEEMYAKLVEFKEQHGHCLVPTEKREYSQLSTWVYAQQKEYRKFKDKDPKGSKLTTDMVVKLHEIGFAFERRDKFFTWEERLEQLRQYKATHGTCKVKTNDPQLGQWTSKMRREYREYMDGKLKKISQETMEKRIRELTELGFVFQAGKRITLPPKHMRKSWEERFDELMEFKAEHGHTIVPQSTPGLGEWVHRQRKDYKALKENRPTQMTAERAIQLTEVGFCFDTRNKANLTGVASASAVGKLPMGVGGDESTLPPLTKNLYLPPETTTAAATTARPVYTGMHQV